MGDKLKGQVALVTGGGRGIGEAVSLYFAEQGASVMVADAGVARDGSGSDAAPAEQVVSKIKEKGGNAIANFTSITDFNAVEEMINTCVATFGKLDILVNCAGVLRERMIVNMTEDEWYAVLNVHLNGSFNLCRHVCAKMKEQKGGRIILLTSDAWRGSVGQSNYASAKGGMVSLCRAVAREMGRYGVTINAIAPMAATRMTMTEEVKAGLKKRMEAGIITKEQYESFFTMPGPEFIPPMIAYLASDAAANINGQVFHVEKGRVSIYSEPIEVRSIFKTSDNGMFTIDELVDAVPKTLLTGYINPAPPKKE